MIILDACRFDYFKEEYNGFINGELTKVWSPAPITVKWLGSVWTGEYPHKYFSSIPRVNSLGISWWGWSAVKHFSQVVDVWNFGWDEDLGTVHPKEMNKAVRERLGDGCAIIHYIQPHVPYIGESQYTWRREITEKNQINRFSHIVNKTRKTFIRKKRHEGDWGGLRTAYRDNLRLVLSYLPDVLSMLRGVTVITADHGEILGEGDRLFHDQRWEGDPILHEVPWLVVQ